MARSHAICHATHASRPARLARADALASRPHILCFTHFVCLRFLQGNAQGGPGGPGRGGPPGNNDQDKKKKVRREGGGKRAAEERKEGSNSDVFYYWSLATAAAAAATTTAHRPCSSSPSPSVWPPEEVRAAGADARRQAEKGEGLAWRHEKEKGPGPGFACVVVCVVASCLLWRAPLALQPVRHLTRGCHSPLQARGPDAAHRLPKGGFSNAGTHITWGAFFFLSRALPPQFLSSLEGRAGHAVAAFHLCCAVNPGSVA